MRSLVILIFSITILSIEAQEKNELEIGIELFEIGEFDRAKNVFKKLTKNADAYYYLGLIHDPEFNRIPFSDDFILYDKPNEKLTQSYYRKAADLGNIYANFQLGKYYQTLYLRRQNWKRGDKFYRKAKGQLEEPANNDDWLANYMMAIVVENNKKPYGERALVLLEEEAKKGDRWAQFYMGRSVSQWMCRKDKCRDYANAYAWFVTAATQGSYHAKFYLFHLMQIMQDHEIKQGEKLAKEYVSKYVIQD